MLLQKFNRRHEARALQTLAIQRGGRRVGRGHQGHARGKEAAQQFSQNHGVTDVADLKLVQAQHADAQTDARADVQQWIRHALQTRQFVVHHAHEAVEMPALGLARGQTFVEQIHQKGLAAPDATPQIQPGHRLRRGTRAQMPAEAPQQPRLHPGLREQRGVQAVQRGQQRALRGVILPALSGDARGISRAGQHEIQCCAHATSRNGGSQPRIAWRTAPRKSIRRR